MKKQRRNFSPLQNLVPALAASALPYLRAVFMPAVSAAVRTHRIT
jgi:hypothetical protein